MEVTDGDRVCDWFCGAPPPEAVVTVDELDCSHMGDGELPLERGGTNVGPGGPYLIRF